MVMPTIYLSNWSSHRTPGHHGPGRKFTIMVAPRRWESGSGPVYALMPTERNMRAAKAGQITVDEYRRRFEQSLAGRLPTLAPGALGADAPPGPDIIIQDGDTLCCACSREEAAAGRCHRVWVADALVRAGWRVILDGVPLDGAA